MVKRERIYVSGPYTAPTLEGVKNNIIRAFFIGANIMEMGHYPFVPHHTHYIESAANSEGFEFTYDDWLDLDIEYLLLCDAIYYMCPSPGADLELKIARRNGLKVYRRLNEIPRVKREHRRELRGRGA